MVIILPQYIDKPVINEDELELETSFLDENEEN